ncbi:MAG: hypothetical protein IIB16_10520, partial [Chloroflexi bacterium]|nr:hypothetical protein [Chloroflexota bacterium]
AGVVVDTSVTGNALNQAGIVGLAGVAVPAFVKLPRTVRQVAGSSGHKGIRCLVVSAGSPDLAAANN